MYIVTLPSCYAAPLAGAVEYTNCINGIRSSHNECPIYDIKSFDDTIYQPLRSGRIWHKANFKAEFNRFEFRVFLLLD